VSLRHHLMDGMQAYCMEELSVAIEKKINFVILGLLNHEALTGYEIKKRIDNSLRFFWSGSFGSIYPTLDVLVQDGCVEKEEETSGRGKIIYSITEKGRVLLREWLMKPVKKDELRYETLLKLFFGGELGREGILVHIQNFEEKIKKELLLLEMYVQNLERVQNEEDHKYYLITVKFGVETYRAYLRWCEEARNILLHD
jgi:DNA-binding PadR family transcriptional regulator